MYFQNVCSVQLSPLGKLCSLCSLRTAIGAPMTSTTIFWRIDQCRASKGPGVESPTNERDLRCLVKTEIFILVLAASKITAHDRERQTYDGYE